MGSGEGFGEFAAIHFGHDDIGDEDIGFEAILSGEVDGFLGGGEGSDFESEFLEGEHGEFADHVIIFDEHDISGAFRFHG